MMPEEKAVQQKFSVQGRIKSFGYAFKGIRIFIGTQHNAWLHIVAAILVIGSGWWLQITTIEWCMISLAIGIVLVAECLNTAIEFLTDIVAPEYNIKAGQVKDLAAAAVQLAALSALAIGGFVFVPHLFALLQK